MVNHLNHEQMSAYCTRQTKDIMKHCDLTSEIDRAYIGACLRLAWLDGQGNGMDAMRAIYSPESDMERARRAGKRG